MFALLRLAGWALLVLVVYKAGSILIERRRHAANAKKLGCQPAPSYPYDGFFGLRQLRHLLNADKNMKFPDALVERHQLMSRRTGRECATFQSGLLGQTLVFTSDPVNIQALLATQFHDFGLGTGRRGTMMPTLGDGIFTQDGPAWEQSRAQLRPSFARDQISDLALFERHVQNLLAVIPVRADGWTAATDIQTLFFRLTIDSSTEFLFGESVDSQLTDAAALGGGGGAGGAGPDAAPAAAHNVRAFAQHFEDAQRHLARRFRLGDLFWLHNPRSFRDNNRAIGRFADHYVALALQRHAQAQTSKAPGDGKYVFLDELMQVTQDPAALRAQLLNILLAGRDTTASLLAWVFHELLRHPAAFARLRAAVCAAFGPWHAPRDLSFAALKACPELQHCLAETQRLRPVVPTNGRQARRDTTLPRGGGPDGRHPVYIPAGHQVGYSIHVMHRRPDLWGPDADEFRPERFRGRKLGWDFLPFNGGPRICLGQQFALTEASYVLVRLLQRFDQILPPTDDGPDPAAADVLSDLTLTSCPGRPVTLRLHAVHA